MIEKKMPEKIPNPKFCLNEEQFSFLARAFLVAGEKRKNDYFFQADLHRKGVSADGAVFSKSEEAHDELKAAIQHYEKVEAGKMLVKVSIDSVRQEGSNHATALCVDFQNKKITYQDSMGDSAPVTLVNLLAETLPDFSFDDLKIKQQTDDASCTFYAFVNLQDMSNGLAITEEDEVDIPDTRMKLQTILNNHWWPRYVKSENEERAKLLATVREGIEAGDYQILEETDEMIELLIVAEGIRAFCKKPGLQVDCPPKGENQAFFIFSPTEE